MLLGRLNCNSFSVFFFFEVEILFFSLHVVCILCDLQKSHDALGIVWQCRWPAMRVWAEIEIEISNYQRWWWSRWRCVRRLSFIALIEPVTFGYQLWWKFIYFCKIALISLHMWSSCWWTLEIVTNWSLKADQDQETRARPWSWSTLRFHTCTLSTLILVGSKDWKLRNLMSFWAREMSCRKPWPFVSRLFLRFKFKERK